MSEELIDNYAEFWDFYVLEHSQPMTRYFHFVGTTLGMVMVAWFIKGGDYLYIPLGFVVAYAFAWFSHFFIEKNTPATFKYPFWSLISDYKMVWYMLTGRMNGELERILAAK
jgi:hypothetical protein